MTLLRGPCSWFGGPDDLGVSASEGLAFIYDVTDAPWLFLPQQPPGTTGLARRLNPKVHYVACRWDYAVTPKSMLIDMPVVVTAPSTGRTFPAYCADWGPHEDTGRIADLSPGLMAALEIDTDDIVEVYFEPEEFMPVTYSTICISSGHSSKCQGAVGIINEVVEARKVVDRVVDKLMDRGVTAHFFHDDISDDQSENLGRICDWHNSHTRQLDVSVHFNAHVPCTEGKGTEVLYATQEALAAKLSAAISDASGLKDRGAKYRGDDLAFLRNTEMPAVLIEVAFVDSETDVGLYHDWFEEICEGIATVLGGEADEEEITPPPTEVYPTVKIRISIPPGVKVVIEYDWFEEICEGITTVLGGEADVDEITPPPTEVMPTVKIRISIPPGVKVVIEEIEE